MRRRAFIATISGAVAALWPFKSAQSATPAMSFEDQLRADALDFRIEAARKVGYAEGYAAGQKSMHMVFLPASDPSQRPRMAISAERWQRIRAAMDS